MGPARLGAVVVALLAATTGLAAPAAHAAAPHHRQAHATVALKPVARQITAGTRAHFTFSGTHLRATTVRLQRQVGTSWRTVGRAAGRKGAVRSSKVPMGRARFRAIAVNRHGARVARSRVRVVYSYGDVSVTRLCTLGSWHDSCAAGTHDVGGQVFVAQAAKRAAHDWSVMWTIADTSCRSIHFRLANPTPVADGDTMYARLVQRHADPLTVEIGPESIQPLNAALKRGAFRVEVSQLSPQARNLLVRGHASCWTSNGRART